MSIQGTSNPELQLQNPNNGYQQPANGWRLPESETQTMEALSPAQLAEIWSRRAQILAEPPPVEAQGQQVNLLVFRLGQERYAIEVANVLEIYPLESITPVPRTPDFVAGVFNARGRILSVIDLSIFFNLLTPSGQNLRSEGDNEAKIIVVTNAKQSSQSSAMVLGVLADGAEEVITIFTEDIAPPLATHTGPQAVCQQGITLDMIVVLDLKALFNDTRLVIQEELL